jgi:hypothetical protein
LAEKGIFGNQNERTFGSAPFTGICQMSQRVKKSKESRKSNGSMGEWLIVDSP